MTFNKKKYLELMSESNKLLQEGKYLGDFDQAKNQELIQYSTLLWDHEFWKSRNQYLHIIESFVSGSLDIDEFINKFNNLQGLNIEASKKLEENLENEIDFQPNLESRKFSEIISWIDETIELFDPKVTLDMNLLHPDLLYYGISEEFLKLDLKDNLLP